MRLMVAMSALTFGRVGTLVEYSTTVGSSLITELRHNGPPTPTVRFKTTA